jgi:hypothetical protein
MAFQPDELEQLQSLFDRQQDTILNKVEIMLDSHRNGIMTDVRVVLNVELREIKDKLARILKMESEDIHAVSVEVEDLKKKIRLLERKIATLEK